MLSDAQIREVFHFCFLERLLKLSDPRIYALKGVVNLRFFFNSPRYSEDMDIDVLAGGVTTLKKMVTKSCRMRHSNAACGCSILKISRSMIQARQNKPQQHNVFDFP